MPLSPEERRKLRERCAISLYGFGELSPAEEFQQLADWCRANGFSHDNYGEGALIEDFERRIAELTGKAAKLPSSPAA